VPSTESVYLLDNQFPTTENTGSRNQSNTEDSAHNTPVFPHEIGERDSKNPATDILYISKIVFDHWPKS